MAVFVFDKNYYDLISYAAVGDSDNILLPSDIILSNKSFNKLLFFHHFATDQDP